MTTLDLFQLCLLFLGNCDSVYALAKHCSDYCLSLERVIVVALYKEECDASIGSLCAQNMVDEARAVRVLEFVHISSPLVSSLLFSYVKTVFPDPTIMEVSHFFCGSSECTYFCRNTRVAPSRPHCTTEQTRRWFESTSRCLGVAYDTLHGSWLDREMIKAAGAAPFPFLQRDISPCLGQDG